MTAFTATCVPAGWAGREAFAVVTVSRFLSGSFAGPYATTYDLMPASGLGVHVTSTPAAVLAAITFFSRDGLDARYTSVAAVTFAVSSTWR